MNNLGDSKGPYNWLTQSSLDTFSDHLLTLPTTQESQTSLLFTIGKPPTKPLRRKGPGPSFGKGKNLYQFSEIATLNEPSKTW